MATPRSLLDQQLRSGSRPTAPLRPLRPLTRLRGGTRVGVRALVLRYMAAAVVLLAIVLVFDPHDTDSATTRSSRPWQYQRESVQVQGRGPLNAYARGAIRSEEHTSALQSHS